MKHFPFFSMDKPWTSSSHQANLIVLRNGSDGKTYILSRLTTIFTALRRRKTYLQSVELFYGLILLAIVRVYTIEKHCFATPKSSRQQAEKAEFAYAAAADFYYTWQIEYSMGWKDPDLGLGRFQALETSLAATVVLIVWKNTKKYTTTCSTTASVARLLLDLVAVNFNETCVTTTAAKSVLNGAFISVVVTVVNCVPWVTTNFTQNFRIQRQQYSSRKTQWH